ncbi:MAG: HesB/IscA family protein [Actinomycetota bacterium]
MLTLTDQAIDVVRKLTQAPEESDPIAGVRLAPGGNGLEISLVDHPVAGDDVVETDGATVFLEPEASQLLEEHTLDATVADGQVSFFLAQP